MAMICLFLFFVVPVIFTGYLFSNSPELFFGASGVGSSIRGNLILFLVYFCTPFVLLFLYVLITYINSISLERLELRTSQSIQKLHDDLILSKGYLRNYKTQGYPRARIVKTPDRHWQNAVSKLISATDYIIIDISVGSENIQWEIDQIKETCPEKCIILEKSQSSNVKTKLEFIPKAHILYDSYQELEMMIYGWIKNKPIWTSSNKLEKNSFGVINKTDST